MYKLLTFKFLIKVETIMNLKRIKNKMLKEKTQIAFFILKKKLFLK